MKKILCFAVSLIALFIGASHAAPFYSVDVVVGATSCGITVDAQPKVTVAVKTTAISAARPTGVYCEYDVAGLAPGAHTITATAIAVADPVYGTQESAATPPLTTTKPAAPAVPQNPKLSATAG